MSAVPRVTERPRSATPTLTSSSCSIRDPRFDDHTRPLTSGRRGRRFRAESESKTPLGAGRALSRCSHMRRILLAGGAVALCPLGLRPVGPAFERCRVPGRVPGLGDERHGHRGLQLPDVLPVLLQHQAGRPRAGGHEGHGGGGEHFCRANNAYKVNKGHYGDDQLDGAKFWISGDLGADFSNGEMDWAVLTFDKSLTPAQRDGIEVIAGHLFPVKWNRSPPPRASSTSGSSPRTRPIALSTAARPPRSLSVRPPPTRPSPS